MTFTQPKVIAALFSTAVVFTIIGFIIGYYIGRKTENPVKFAIKFTALQVVGVLLFIGYNRVLTSEPDRLVNLGLLALTGGETVGMLITRGGDKVAEKIADKATKDGKKS